MNGYPTISKGLRNLASGPRKWGMLSAKPEHYRVDEKRVAAWQKQAAMAAENTQGNNHEDR